jgi:hypothetical protein
MSITAAEPSAAAAVATATAAVTATKFVLSEISKWTYSCAVIVENHSSFCLYHNSSKDIYGNFATGKLPTIPPIFLSETKSFYFDEVVGLENAPKTPKAPCSVMVWNIVGSKKCLVVYYYGASTTIGDNSGLFEITNHTTADKWYKENKRKYKKYNEIASLKYKIRGHDVTAVMNNENPCIFKITIS